MEGGYEFNEKLKMAKYLDEDGNEVEAFTQEEVDAKVKEQESQLAKEKEELEAKLKENEERIEGLEKKGESVVELREKSERLEKEMKEKEEAFEKEKQELQEKIPDPNDALIKEVTRGDEELMGKIKARLAEYKEPPADEETFKQRLKDAYIVETVEDVPDALAPVIGSGGGGDVPTEAEGVSPDLVELGKSFGLSGDDWKDAKNKGVI